MSLCSAEEADFLPDCPVHHEQEGIDCRLVLFVLIIGTMLKQRLKYTVRSHEDFKSMPAERIRDRHCRNYTWPCLLSARCSVKYRGAGVRLEGQSKSRDWKVSYQQDGEERTNTQGFPWAFT